MERRPLFLSLAGSDPSGGAGLQADIRVAQTLGCYPMAVPVALTAQSTMGVRQVWTLSPQQVTAQLTTLLDDIRPDAVKIGMLGNLQVAQAVRETLEHYNIGNVVTDTIMTSTSGACLLELSDETAENAFARLLMRSRVITPNIPEAAVLLGLKDDTEIKADPEGAARQLSRQYGGVSVYLKGGHADGQQLTDFFFNAEDHTILRLTQPRLATNNTHGTGCVLSSALACMLAKGMALSDAAREANTFMHQALEQARDHNMGHGHGPSFV